MNAQTAVEPAAKPPTTFTPDKKTVLVPSSVKPVDGYVYLASPYSHPSKEQQEARWVVICRVAANMMNRGWRVFSPIAHSHPIEQYGGAKNKGHDFWMNQDLALLAKADALVIATIPGWTFSKGVGMEIEYAKKHGIPILTTRTGVSVSAPSDDWLDVLRVEDAEYKNV